MNRRKFFQTALGVAGLGLLAKAGLVSAPEPQANRYRFASTDLQGQWIDQTGYHGIVRVGHFDPVDPSKDWHRDIRL